MKIGMDKLLGGLRIIDLEEIFGLDYRKDNEKKLYRMRIQFLVVRGYE